MYGFWYSVRQHYSFTWKELTELLWTSLTFSFILTAYYKGFFYKPIILWDTIGLFIALLLCIFMSLHIHVALQKLAGIKLGYKVTYDYWINGLLLSLFLSLLTFGLVPVLSMLIFPGSVMMEHLPALRLGKFRYGTNAKDIARVSLAGPLAHILIVMVLGIFYLTSSKSEILFQFITVNLMLLIYSMLPIPKIDLPTRINGASDGLGIFFFSRTIYILCLATSVFYAVLIWAASTFSFVIAFILGAITTIMYIITVGQKN